MVDVLPRIASTDLIGRFDIIWILQARLWSGGHVVPVTTKVGVLNRIATTIASL